MPQRGLSLLQPRFELSPQLLLLLQLFQPLYGSTAVEEASPQGEASPRLELAPQRELFPLLQLLLLLFLLFPNRAGTRELSPPMYAVAVEAA